ncbi:hypothetical protein, partial [Vibrio cidicii]
QQKWKIATSLNKEQAMSVLAFITDGETYTVRTRNNGVCVGRCFVRRGYVLVVSNKDVSDSEDEQDMREVSTAIPEDWIASVTARRPVSGTN